MGKISIFKAWTPYVMIGLLLVLTRVRSLPFGGLGKICRPQLYQHI